MLNSLSEDQNVVQVYYYNAFHNEVLKDIIHYGLEGDQTIGHPKEHHQGLEQTTIGVEDSLLLVSRLDSYIVKTLADVQFGEVLGFAQLRHKFGDEWQRVFILYCYRVESLIILY